MALPWKGGPRCGSSPRHALAGPLLRVTPRSRQRRVTCRDHVSEHTHTALVPATVYSLGEALFDCMADQRGVEREHVKSWTPYPGGAPANLACAMQKLGTHSAFLSAMGQDELASNMLDLLAELGVDTSDVQRNDKPTRDVLLTFTRENDRSFVGFGSAANHDFADCFIEADKLPLAKIKAAGALVTGTLGLAYPETAKAMHTALDAARTGPCSVLVDVNWRPVFWEGQELEAPHMIREYVNKADIIKLAGEEAEFIYGVNCEDALYDPIQVLNLVAPTVQGVLVTGGAKGCGYAFRSLFNREILSGYVPVLKVDVKDTTGAGDAFLAGFLFGMLKAGGLEGLSSDERKIRKACEFAAATGGYTTTRNGGIAAQPTYQQAMELLSTADFA